MFLADPIIKASTCPSCFNHGSLVFIVNCYSFNMNLFYLTAQVGSQEYHNALDIVVRALQSHLVHSRVSFRIIVKGGGEQRL